MLTLGSTPQPVVGTMGQFFTTRAQFTSRDMLTGRNIRMNPALFVDNSFGSSSPTTNAWELIYPNSAGIYPMRFIGADIYRNYFAELHVVNAFTFAIELTFQFVSDIDGYVGSVPPINNNDPFVNSGLYVTPQGLEMHVSDGINSIVSFVPVSANTFCQDSVTFTTSGTDNGFTPGQSLGLNVFINEENISSTYYLGFYQTTGISNATHFVDDSNLSYTQISNGVSNIPNIPNDAIVSGSGFIGRNDAYNATAEIDKSYLQEGQCYRAFVVYQAGGEWRSCISDEICQTEAAIPPAVGDFDCQITDAIGNVWSECCLVNAPTCGTTKICVTPNQATFDSLYATAGLTGTFNDYFVSADSFVSDSFPTSENPGIPSQSTVNSSTLCIDYTPNQNDVDVKYFVFRYMFDYGTHSDVIDVVAQVTFNGSVQDVDFTGTFADGSVLGSNFCAENQGLLTIDYPAETANTCVLVQSINGGNTTPANVVSSSPGQIVIDTDTINVGDQLCLISCCADEDVDTPCDCSEFCDNISFTITQDTCGFVEGVSTGTVVLDLQLSGVTSNEVQSINVQTSTGSTLTSSTGFLNQNFTANFSNQLRIGYDIVVTLENGCVYEPPIIWLETEAGDISVNCVANFLGTVAPSSCDCSTVPDPECNNFASITPSCDSVTGEIDFVSFDSFNSPVASDVTECSEDGSVFAPCVTPYVGTELHVRRIVQFSDDCPDLEINQLITCDAVQNCENMSELVSNITGNTLTLTGTGSYSSTVATETIFVSLDGGATFAVYTTPITLTGGESIVAYMITTFDDGCPDIESNTITETFAFDCNYTAYSVECAFDETAGTFSATFIGDQSLLSVNNQLYSVDGSNPTTPYPGAVTGQIFLVRWEIALPGCPTVCLNAACADCDSITGNCFDAGNGVDSAGC